MLELSKQQVETLKSEVKVKMQEQRKECFNLFRTIGITEQDVDVEGVVGKSETYFHKQTGDFLFTLWWVVEENAFGDVVINVKSKYDQGLFEE